MDKKNKISIVGMIIAILLIGAGIGVFVIKNMTPSNEVMLLTDYYKVEDTEAIIILQDEIHDKPGIIADGKVYIDLETVVNCFNHRFYWDDNENILTYTTPTEIIQVDGVGNKYFVTKSMIKTEATSDYPILKLYNDDIYIALDFVDQYSDIQYRSYEEPNRVVIDYLWESISTQRLQKHPIKIRTGYKGPSYLNFL